MNQLGRALLEARDPPINMLFVYNSNPAVTTPDQRRVLRGLERDDLFTVVFEQVMTDTARYADVLLPNTTFLEGYDLVKSYGPWTLRTGPAGHRARRRVALECRRLRGAARSDRAARGRRIRAASSKRCSTSSHSLPETIGDEVRENGAAIATVRRTADPVPRRLSAHRWIRRSDLYPEALASDAHCGTVRLSAGPGNARASRSRSSRRPARRRSARRSRKFRGPKFGC